MKIVYAVSGLWTQHPGIQAKVIGATKIWASLGNEVFIVLHSQGLVLDHEGQIIYKSKKNVFSDQKIDYYDRSLNKFKRLISLRHQHRFLRTQILKLQPDIVYTRYTLPYPGVHKNFDFYCPFIIEINSDDSIEYGIKSKLTGIVNNWFRKSFISRAAGVCFISKELQISSAFSWYKGKTAVISNSIDSARYKWIPETGNRNVNICFIGSPGQRWHGLDKVFRLAEIFPEWSFHIIGPDKKALAHCGEIDLKNIYFHGYLVGDEMLKLVGSMDVAISSLALHRLNLVEASPLKSRQYLAQGIPFISGYIDTDISNEDFILQLKGCESNVISSIPLIEAFVSNVFGNKRLRAKARLFSEEVLDTSIKERMRAEFLCSVLDK